MGENWRKESISFRGGGFVEVFGASSLVSCVSEALDEKEEGW